VDGQAIEFYIEGTRSRSGKMLPPKTGMLSTVTSTFLDRKVPNINIIPLAINYERVSASAARLVLLHGAHRLHCESVASTLRRHPRRRAK
jgi:glycerol-3-phosphate O-acyltransferase